MYGLLAFLYSLFEVALAQVHAAFVANGVEWNHLGEVVHVALFFFQRAIDISQCSVIVGVILCIESMPKPAPRSVLLGGASRRDQTDCNRDKGKISSYARVHTLLNAFIVKFIAFIVRYSLSLRTFFGQCYEFVLDLVGHIDFP